MSEYDDELLSTLMFYHGNDLDRFADYKIEYLKRELPQAPKRLLEFGCGTGRNMKKIKELFPDTQLFGCDVHEDSIIEARKNHPDIKFEVTTDTESVINSYRDKGIDAIFVAGVFHHIPPESRQGFMDCLFEILAPGGEAVIYEQNPWNPATHIIFKRSSIDEGCFMVYPKSLKQMISQSGFTGTKINYTLFFIQRNKVTNAIEHRLNWLPVGSAILRKSIEGSVTNSPIN